MQLIYTLDDINKISSANFGTLNSLGILSEKSEVDIAFPSELLNQLNAVKNIKAFVTLNTPNPSTNFTEVISIPEKAFFKLKIQSSFQLENHIGG